MRELRIFEKTPHRLRVLRILSRQESSGFSQKDRKEAEKSQGEKSSRR